MVIHQGDVFWIDLGEPRGSAPGYRHPHVVVQNNVFNQSRINTVVVCVITSNLARAAAPGNVLLRKGEAGLSKASVVNVSQVITVDKAELGARIGSLSPKRTREVVDGLASVFKLSQVDFWKSTKAFALRIGEFTPQEMSPVTRSSLTLPEFTEVWLQRMRYLVFPAK